jgi:hypothetical protein
VEVNSLSNELVMLTNTSAAGVTPNTTNFYDLISRDQQPSSPSSVLAVADIISPVFPENIVAAEQKKECSSELNLIDVPYSEHIQELDILQYQLGLPREIMVPDLSMKGSGLAIESISKIGNLSQIDNDISVSLASNAVIKPSDTTGCVNDRVDVAMLSIATGQLAYGFYGQSPAAFQDASGKYVTYQSHDIKLSRPIADYSSTKANVAGFEMSPLNSTQYQPSFLSAQVSQSIAAHDDYTIDGVKATQIMAHHFLDKFMPRKMTLISSGESSTLYIRDYFSNDAANDLYFPYAQKNIRSIDIERVVVNGFIIKNIRTI